MPSKRPAKGAAKPAPRKPRTPKPPPERRVTVSVQVGGFYASAEPVPLSEVDAVRADLVARGRAALAAHPELRERVSMVPGGAIGYVDDGDYGGRVGFKA